MTREKDSTRKKIAGILYGLTAAASIFMGCVYLFSPGIMPYHAEALSLGQARPEPALEILISSLMKVAGGGWLTLGVAVIVLLLYPFKEDREWSVYAIPALILLFYVPGLFATLTVLQYTPSSPPWIGNLVAIIAAVAGFLIYPKISDRDRN